MTAPAARRGGMTLIEVMLALALFGMLTLFVFSVINSVLSLWQTGERRGNGDLAFAATVEGLRRDMQALHVGSRGWLILDDWEAAPADGELPPWRLPRLRLLADGAALPADDPTGHGAVEVAWLLAPVDPLESRLSRLVRLARRENGNPEFRDDRVFQNAVRAGGGVPVLDGVVWTEFRMTRPDGTTTTAFRVPPDSPLDFPAELELVIERVSTDSQRRPLTLDSELNASSTRITVRGTAPLSTPEHLLLDREWIQVTGSFPTFTVVERGARGTAIADHPRDAVVLAPERYVARARLAAGGRRLTP